MQITPLASRAVILVKALPQPSKTYGETVCCAGVTASGEWKRLFPVRFRHLKGASSFARWDWVRFQYRRPTRDARFESCHVHEDSIQIDGRLPLREHSKLLVPLVTGSAAAAFANGHSLALIRPRNTRFIYKAKSPDDIEQEREAYRKAASQTSMFDKELAELEPSPYDFRFRFDDDAGSHDYQCGDWETHAMFWRWREEHVDDETLKRMGGVFNDDYPRKGMAFAVGNQAKRPQTWQLLGVIRLDESKQGELPL
jgi:hypothetical protein